MTAGPRRRVWLEIAVVAGAAAVGLIAARPPAPKLLWGLEIWIIPAILLYAPIIAAWIARGDFVSIGLGAPRWRDTALDLAVLIVVILPVFLVSWWALAKHVMGAAFVMRFPEAPVSLALGQLIVVALPEEVFFRGWLQGRLNQVMPWQKRIWRAPVGPGLFIAAAMFAGAHYLVSPRPISLLVFFPGLMFGYFRETSGSVAGPVIAHALCNFSFLILQKCAVFP